ncbi:hypothetical protein DID88_009359 [Monilinia fructigena]|uniref:Citrate synthase n=1 Tax=Monilinia fructigena TaxID=38457 RepID=A0A395ISV5_9HELO|nr:hypothetical protein DID88_009359 [Monilinia fructigena]
MAMNSRTASHAFRSLRPFGVRSLAVPAHRNHATLSEPDLKATFKECIPAKRELLKKVKAKSGKVIGEIKLENTIGGMRGLKAMVWEGSVLDADDGIRFHGRTIKDCQKELPKGTSGTEMLPEAMFWLLLTGQVPSTSQVRQFSKELAEQSALPDFVNKMLDDFPRDLHPMTQFATAVSALSHTSKFAKAYEKGVHKADYWEPTFDDTMLGKGGKENENFQDLLRLYLALHGDHEGGNVSAHATHLVGSALSDPFLSYSAGLQGLAGPLHGLAAQEVLRWILQMQEHLGTKSTDKDVSDYLWSTLKSGRVVPGYGHAVLRKPDPRFEALMDYASSRPEIANDPVFQLVKKNSEIAPGVLKEHGKTKKPVSKCRF